MRNIDKKFKIIIGGATCHQVKIDSLHKNYPEIDFIIWGRGESITEKILNNEITIPGPYDGNQYTFIPIPINDFFLNKLNNADIPIEIDGMTCPWNKCQFCIHSSSKDPTHLSSKDAFQLIKHYYIKGKRYFFICDNWLVMGKLYKVFDMLLSEGITDLSFEFFGIHISADYKRLGEYNRKFHSNFIRNSSWGVEWLDDDILSLYQKGTSVDELFSHAKYMFDNGLNYAAYMIIGLPNIQQKHIDNMYENLLKYNQYVDAYRYSIFTLDEYVDVFKKSKEFGIRPIRQNTIGEVLPINTSIYDYDVYDFEEKKWISKEENIRRFNKITDIIEDRNSKSSLTQNLYKVGE